MTMPFETDNPVTPEADRRPFTLDAERAFVGCLLHCTSRQARGLLAGIRPDDAWQPIAQFTLKLVIDAVVTDTTPSPVVLLASARNSGVLNTEHKHQRFGTWLVDTYRVAPYPEAGPALKTELLEAAYRQAVREQAQRLLEVVALGEFDRVRELATLETDRINDLAHRLDTTTAATITPARAETGHTSQISAPSNGFCRDENTPAHRGAAA